MKLAELPEILVTGGKKNFASYLLQKNETKKIGNSLEQSLTGSTSFKLQGRVTHDFQNWGKEKYKVLPKGKGSMNYKSDYIYVN